jgi:hypothetical protein
MTDSTLYDLLGVQRGAAAEEICIAFHERARQLEKDQTHPEAAQHLQRLRQAYQILGDSQRRAQYDASLPAEKTYEAPFDIAQLWKRVGEAYFQRSDRFTPAIDAVRVAVPLALEDENLLVLGIDHSHTTLMGYLTATITYNEVRQILCELSARQLDFRVIAGTTVKDWHGIRDAEEALRRKRATPVLPAPTTKTEQIESSLPPQQAEVPVEKHGDRWEELMENMFKQWSALDHRGFPQSRARFVLSQVAVALQLEEVSRVAGVSEDVTQRHVARAIDRIASLSGIDSGAVALEYLRMRVNSPNNSAS